MERRPGQDEQFAQFLAQQESDPEIQQELDAADQLAQRTPSVAGRQRKRIAATQQAVAAFLIMSAIVTGLKIVNHITRAFTRSKDPPAIESFEEPADPEDVDRFRLDEAIRRSTSG